MAAVAWSPSLRLAVSEWKSGSKSEISTSKLTDKESQIFGKVIAKSEVRASDVTVLNTWY